MFPYKTVPTENRAVGDEGTMSHTWISKDQFLMSLVEVPHVNLKLPVTEGIHLRSEKSGCLPLLCLWLFIGPMQEIALQKTGRKFHLETKHRASPPSPS